MLQVVLKDAVVTFSKWDRWSPKFNPGLSVMFCTAPPIGAVLSAQRCVVPPSKPLQPQENGHLGSQSHVPCATLGGL